MVTNNKIISLLVAAFIFTQLSVAQVAPKVKYWVNLKNKTGTPYTIGSPNAFLTQKAIDRRNKYNIPINSSDLPVNPVYIQNIDTVKHVTILYVSKWLNGVVIAIDSASVVPQVLNSISTFSFVQSNSKLYKYKLNPLPEIKPTVIPLLKSNTEKGTAAFSYGRSGGQIRQLRVDSLHKRGYRGQGITIAVMDVGFTNVNTITAFDSLRNRGGILGTRDFVDGGTNAYTGGGHGTMVLSCLAANLPGNAVGTAPMANYWLLRTEEGARETISEEYNWIRAAEFADSVGADILTTSLGYTEFDNGNNNHTYAHMNGRTAPMSIAANMAARKGMFVLNAAGNEGNSNWKFIGVAADADSVCAVGSVDTAGVFSSFSSRGPTSDGRTKPDLVACGAGAWICDPSGVCYPGNGTSFATPILAGAVACYWQAIPRLTNHKLLDTLKLLSSNYCSPNQQIGWGIPNFSLGGSNRKVLVSGKCRLSDLTTKSGVKVRFIRLPGLTRTDSVLTDANGNYSVNLVSGVYNIEFFANGFKKQSYPTSSVNLESCINNLSEVVLQIDTNIQPFINLDYFVHCNPDNSILTISLNKLVFEKLAIDVIDVNGRLIYSASEIPVGTDIKLNALTTTDGIYIIKVKSSESVIVKKFLKQ
jgi:serine protease AprX